MASAVGNYSDGETIHGGDLNADLTSLLGNDAQLFLDIFAGWNILVSGFSLTAGVGMAVNIAAGLAYAGGVRLNMAAGAVTLAAGNTQPRYDAIWVQAGKVASTNGTTGNPTQFDGGTFGVTAGTPGGSPAVPALGDQTKVQVGTVYVPANATLASGCVLGSQVTAPNAQGPVRTLVDLLTHIAASMASATVHGFLATTAGGTGAGMLAQTDANGNVGGAAALWDGATRRTLHPYNDSSHVPGEIPQYNANGRVQDSEQLAGHAPGGGNGLDADTVDGSHASAFDLAGAATGVQGNLNTHTGQSHYSQIVHGMESRRGHVTGIAITGGNGFGVVAHVTFSPAMAGTPQNVQLTMDQGNAGGAPPVPQNVTANGFDIAMSTAGTYNGGVYWRADS